MRDLNVLMIKTVARDNTGFLQDAVFQHFSKTFNFRDPDNSELLKQLNKIRETEFGKIQKQGVEVIDKFAGQRVLEVEFLEDNIKENIHEKFNLEDWLVRNHLDEMKILVSPQDNNHIHISNSLRTTGATEALKNICKKFNTESYKPTGCHFFNGKSVVEFVINCINGKFFKRTEYRLFESAKWKPHNTKPVQKFNYKSRLEMLGPDEIDLMNDVSSRVHKALSTSLMDRCPVDLNKVAAMVAANTK